MTREEVYKLADEVLENKCKSHVEAARVFASYIKQGQLIDTATRDQLHAVAADHERIMKSWGDEVAQLKARIEELERGRAT